MKLWLKDDLASRKIVFQRALLFSSVTLFVLFVFQPFGTNNDTIPYKFLRLSGYGLVTFCALLLTGILEIGSIRLNINSRFRLMAIPCIYIGIISVFNHSYFVVAILGAWHWENQLLFFFIPVLSVYFQSHLSYLLIAIQKIQRRSHKSLEVNLKVKMKVK